RELRIFFSVGNWIGHQNEPLDSAKSVQKEGAGVPAVLKIGRLVIFDFLS
ncbi:MAG: hypothetical protein ACI814_001668, partial [Mariniblastus sp.]